MLKMKRYPKDKIIQYSSKDASSLMELDRGHYIVSAPEDYTKFDDIEQDETRDIKILDHHCKISKYEREVGSDFSEGEMFISITLNGNVIGSNYGCPRLAIQEAYEYLRTKRS